MKLLKIFKSNLLVLEKISSYEGIKLIFKEKFMAYTKPQIIAQNASSGSYAAGCPVNTDGPDVIDGDIGRTGCRTCERAR